MGNSGLTLSAPVVLILIITVRVLLHFYDKSKIESAAIQKGWKNILIEWSPFAPGWLFEKSERHYLVTYEDRNGLQHQRYCKTAMFSGIYWRDEGD